MTRKAFVVVLLMTAAVALAGCEHGGDGGTGGGYVASDGATPTMPGEAASAPPVPDAPAQASPGPTAMRGPTEP